jgi:hypothetical protein
MNVLYKTNGEVFVVMVGIPKVVSSVLMEDL